MQINKLVTYIYVATYQGRREGGFQGLLETPFKFKCTMDLYKIVMQEISG